MIDKRQCILIYLIYIIINPPPSDKIKTFPFVIEK